MPTYVYRNAKTGETFELQQRITENALTEHPETGDPVSRVIQQVGIAFKGSGFYKNDSRAAGGSSSTSSGHSKSEGEPSSAVKSEGESSSTPAPVSDSVKSESASTASSTPAISKTS